jgi:hypothetical protein
MKSAGRSLYAALVAGAVALGGLTLSASAAPVAPNLASGVQAASGDLIQVQHGHGHKHKGGKKYKKAPKHHGHGKYHGHKHGKWAYHPGRHGHRYKYRRPGYGYYYGGYWYAQPWWLPGYYYGGPTIVIRP